MRKAREKDHIAKMLLTAFAIFVGVIMLGCMISFDTKVNADEIVILSSGDSESGNISGNGAGNNNSVNNSSGDNASGDSEDDSSNGNNSKNKDKTNKVSTKVPVFITSLSLYKGESRFLSFSKIKKKSQISVHSANSKIAKVYSSGKITAKKAGRTVISVRLKKANSSKQVFKLNINLAVTISSFYSTGNYSKAYKLNKKICNNRMPLCSVNTELKVGQSKKIKVSEKTKGAKVTYKSSSKSVATVDSKGKVKALKTGKAVITVTVKDSLTSYSYKEVLHVLDANKQVSISTTERDKYLSTAAFIGSSVGVGQQMYFNSKGRGFLGGPTMLVRGCYSFANDKNRNHGYMVRYGGVELQAKDAVHACRAKKVFVNMGTNDLGGGLTYTYLSYINYLNGIRSRNPGIIIYIESMTTTRRAKGELNNSNIFKLNKKLKAYAATQKDMYFIDNTTCLLDSHGTMKAVYSSDGYVHLSMAGYAVWTNALCKQLEAILTKEQLAKDAVNTAVESRDKAMYKAAVKKVKALPSSTVKDNLNKQLKSVKSKLK